MKTEDEKRAFYERCGEILGIEHIYTVPVPRRNRWNNRRLGNGRYPGFGLIHCFGNGARVISHNGTRMFNSYDEVYEYISRIMLD
jgi:hypothetical protein